MKVTFCRAIFKKKHGLITTIFFFLRKGKWVSFLQIDKPTIHQYNFYISKKKKTKKNVVVLILLWPSQIDKISGLTTAIIFKNQPGLDCTVGVLHQFRRKSICCSHSTPRKHGSKRFPTSCRHGNFTLRYYNRPHAVCEVHD